MIFQQNLAAVDPASLAAASGVTKPFIPTYRTVIPQVIRPHLLTDQLRGCSCINCGASMGLPPDYGGLRGYMRGLGLVVDPGTDPNTEYTGDPGTLTVPSAGSGNTSILRSIAAGVSFLPGVGSIGSIAIQAMTQALQGLLSWFHIGAGRTEANLIVPTQNNLMTALGGITDQIRTGMNPSLDTLMSLYRQVWMIGTAFQEFVLQKTFTDRRASGQALNTIMPYIDGSCGYSVPVGMTAVPSQQNCLSWGDGTIGGVGTNGMLGAIGRAIVADGGTIQALPNLHDAANSGIKLSTIPVAGGSGTVLGMSTPMLAALGIGVFLLARNRRLFRG